MRIYFTGGQAESVKSLQPQVPVSGEMRGSGQIQRNAHFDLEDAARNLSWIRGSITQIGKNIIGPNWKLVKVREFEDEATPEAKQVLQRFYGLGVTKSYKNIKDFYTTSGKLYATAASFVLSGHSAWEMKRDGLFGTPVGFDYIPGRIEPQIEPNGDFKTPAFKQYLSSSQFSATEWQDPNDIVFFANPDFGGYPYSSDLEALIQYTLPSDIYAALSWLSMHKNRNAPLDGYWTIDPGVSDDVFKTVYAMLYSRYSGAHNYGKTPILAKGQLDFKTISRSEDEAPYLDGRAGARQEMSAVTGVPGGKLGVDGEDMSRDKKRDYYESVIAPIHVCFEETMYEQVHLRSFGIRGWRPAFNNPSFVTEVEQASIDRTYWNIGKVNANELRVRDGEEPREGGDHYFEPANMLETPGTQIGEDPLGENPGAPVMLPSEEDPAGQKPRPVRADEQSLYEELRKWRDLSIKRAKQGKKPRKFETEIIPPAIYDILSFALNENGSNPSFVKDIFDEALRRAKEQCG